MKHFTKLFAALMALITVATIALSLSACKYKDPVELPQEDNPPFGSFDYSKRAFFANQASPEGYCVYKSDVYFLSDYMLLMRAPLTELENDLRETRNQKPPQAYCVCPENTHNHDHWLEVSEDCPAWLCDPWSLFLIDAYESAGDFPIIYSTQSYNATINESVWDQSATYGVYRYDTGKAERECLAMMNVPVSQIMTYDQWVFFVTLNSKDEYQLNVVLKQGGEITTITVGKGEIALLGAYNGRVIFRDKDDAVYQVGFDLKNCQKIFQAPEMYSNLADFQGLFVHGKYLYYPTDYGVIPYPLNEDGTQVANLLQHSVRRISLDNPNGESELVVDNVLDYNMYGVSEDVFYYSPCIAGETVKGCYYNFTGGILKGVNLNTLEAVELNEEVGLDFCYGSFVSGNAVIGVAFPVRKGYHLKVDDSLTCLYDIRTGALYSLDYS